MRDAGEVIRADVRLDNYGNSRGFGTVVFNTEEEAAKAVEMFQGYEIEGRKLDTRPGRSTGSSSGYERDSYRSSDILRNLVMATEANPQLQIRILSLLMVSLPMVKSQILSMLPTYHLLLRMMICMICLKPLVEQPRLKSNMLMTADQVETLLFNLKLLIWLKMQFCN